MKEIESLLKPDVKTASGKTYRRVTSLRREILDRTSSARD